MYFFKCCSLNFCYCTIFCRLILQFALESSISSAWFSISFSSPLVSSLICYLVMIFPCVFSLRRSKSRVRDCTFTVIYGPDFSNVRAMHFGNHHFVVPTCNICKQMFYVFYIRWYSETFVQYSRPDISKVSSYLSRKI